MDKVKSHYTHDSDDVIWNNSIGDPRIAGNNLFSKIIKSKKD